MDVVCDLHQRLADVYPIAQLDVIVVGIFHQVGGGRGGRGTLSMHSLLTRGGVARWRTGAEWLSAARQTSVLSQLAARCRHAPVLWMLELGFRMCLYAVPFNVQDWTLRRTDMLQEPPCLHSLRSWDSNLLWGSARAIQNMLICRRAVEDFR